MKHLFLFCGSFGKRIGDVCYLQYNMIVYAIPQSPRNLLVPLLYMVRQHDLISLQTISESPNLRISESPNLRILESQNFGITYETWSTIRTLVSCSASTYTNASIYLANVVPLLYANSIKCDADMQDGQSPSLWLIRK